MPNSNTFLADIKAHPDRYYIIHYSSEHLFDQDIQGTTPRITSVVVCHYATGQLQSFAIHTAADRLGIARENIADHYDAVELEMLRQLYEFIGTRTQNYWIHWNMRSVVFGFEHLSHRYQVLTRGTAAPVIPVEHRINLNDVLREKFGEHFDRRRASPTGSERTTLLTADAEVFKSLILPAPNLGPDAPSRAECKFRSLGSCRTRRSI